MKKLWLLLGGSLICSLILIRLIWLIRPIKPANISTAGIIYFPEKSPRVRNFEWSLVLTGDIIPARSVNFQMTQKNDFFWPLRGIADVLKNADLTLVNLESPLIPDCPLTNEGMIFCGDQRFGQSLKEAGVDVVNLANNHSLNYGWEGIGQTETLLNNLGMETIGFTSNVILEGSRFNRETDRISNEILSLRASPSLQNDKNFKCQENIFCSHLEIKQVGNIKIAFLGYNTVGQKLDRELVGQQINQAKQQADLLVISIHWGAEYAKEPAAESEDPKELGRWLIDQGADIIVGNHPHVIQPYEYYQNGVIFYALGNTVFDQEWSPDTKKGILVKLHFSGTQIAKDKTEIIPIGIKNYGEAFLR